MAGDIISGGDSVEEFATIKKGERAPEVLSLCFVKFVRGYITHCCVCFHPESIPLFREQFQVSRLTVFVPCEGHVRSAWQEGFEDVPPDDELDDE